MRSEPERESAEQALIKALVEELRLTRTAISKPPPPQRSVLRDIVVGLMVILLAAAVIGISSMNTKLATQGVELRGLKSDVEEIKADITRHHP